jgi:O-antigen/teichoic acid export membrane protein
LNTKDDPEAITYGKHLSAMTIITTVAGYLDRLLIFHFLGATEVAIYSIAIAPPEQIKGLIKNLNTLALPKFSEKSLAEINASIWSKILKLALLIILTIATYLIAAPFIYQIFFPSYLEAIPLSQLFALSLVANAMFIPLSIMQSQKMSRQLYQFNFITSAIQIGALLAIIPFFNLYTVVMARVLARFSGLFLATWQLKRTAKTTTK